MIALLHRLQMIMHTLWSVLGLRHTGMNRSDGMVSSQPSKCRYGIPSYTVSLPGMMIRVPAYSVLYTLTIKTGVRAYCV